SAQSFLNLLRGGQLREAAEAYGLNPLDLAAQDLADRELIQIAHISSTCCLPVSTSLAIRSTSGELDPAGIESFLVLRGVLANPPVRHASPLPGREFSGNIHELSAPSTD